MGIRHFDVMDLGKASLIKPEQLGYKDSLEIIKDESYKIQKSFVKIGWYLKHIRDHALYAEGGYANIWECAADQLGYSQSTASRFINICEKFSKNHNSPELDEKYAGFDKSQMIEMLPMEPEQLDRVSPDMTVKQIRDIKVENKEPEKKNDQEADDNIPGQTSLEKDFPEYMPKQGTEELKEDISDVYATSHKEDNDADPDAEEIIDGEYREIEEVEEENNVVPQSAKDGTHDESWFVEQYVRIMSNEAAELFEICRKERNNSDRAKAIQKHIAPYGCYSTHCSEYSFAFHGFAAGIDFWIGSEKIHLKYGRFAVELMKLLEKEVATSQPEEKGQQEEKLSPYGLPKTVYPEGSLVTTVGCGHKHSCFSCSQDCAIRQEDRYCNGAPLGNPFPCTTMHVLEDIRFEIGGQCQFINLDMAEHTAGSNEPDPCCKNCAILECDYRCRRALEMQASDKDAAEDELSKVRRLLEEKKQDLEEWMKVAKVEEVPKNIVFEKKTIVGALASMVYELENTEPEVEEIIQPELPVLKNNDQRKEWLADYNSWGLWYRDENIDVNYYKYDFSDGSRLVVAEYPQRHTYYSSEYKDEYYYHLLEKNKKGYKKPYDEQFRQQTDSETYLVEFLKDLQKKG